jgi:tetracycline resistance efflux pump
MTQQLDATTVEAAEERTTSFSAGRRTIAGYSGLAVLFLVSILAPSGDSEYGLWSLLPAVTLFGFILTTHRVIEGFLWAGLLAQFMIHRLGLPAAWMASLDTQLTDSDNVWLLVLLTIIGGLLGVFERMGLSASFARAVSRLARGPRAAGGFTAMSSLLLSNDSYLSASGVGVSMSPVNRRFGLPRAFTASVVRSTGEPGTTLNPFGTTSVLIAGLLIGAGYGAGRSEVAVYLDVLPYLFYSFAAVIIGVLLAVRVVPAVGAMRREFAAVAVDDEAEAQDAATGPHFLNFLVPIGVVVVSGIALGDIQLGFVLALFVTGALLIAQRVTTVGEYVDAVLEGMKEIFSLVLLMALAFVLVGAVSELGFTEFIIDSVGGVIAPQWLPFAIFLVFGLTEMLVTLNWSLYILLVPVLVTLAGELHASVPMTVAALLSAGTFGVAAAISSDVGLLTATSTRVPLYRHWITNLPYQLSAAGIALVGFAVLGMTG